MRGRIAVKLYFDRTGYLIIFDSIYDGERVYLAQSLKLTLYTIDTKIIEIFPCMVKLLKNINYVSNLRMASTGCLNAWYI